MPGRPAPPSGASAAPMPPGGRGKPAAAHASPSGTGTAAGGRGTGGTRRRAGAFCVLVVPCTAGGATQYLPGGGGGGVPCRHVRSTTAATPCPNIPPGWPCPWALCLAAPGQARYPRGGESTSRPPGSDLVAPLCAPPKPTLWSSSRVAFRTALFRVCLLVPLSYRRGCGPRPSPPATLYPS